MGRQFDEAEEDWLPTVELAQLNREKELFQIEDTIYTEKILKEASPIAAKRLIQIAKTHPDANTALRAITQILDRTGGKPTVRQEIKTNSGTMNLMDDVMQQVEELLAGN